MSWVGLLAVSVALAMDAFAVAVVAGLTLGTVTRRHLFRLSFHFGLFQAMMLGLGWLVGTALFAIVAAVATWIAFILLTLVGVNAIWHGVHQDDETPRANDPTSGWQLVFLSFATSVDAFGVGISLAMIRASIAVSACAVGVIATIFTLLGMGLGRRIRTIWGKRVEVLGGLILLGIGVKILLDYLRK
jgi:manganese efflux pump family protein